jgi:hypothetical protein
MQHKLDRQFPGPLRDEAKPKLRKEEIHKNNDKKLKNHVFDLVEKDVYIHKNKMVNNKL